jgi:hypothetical protein
MAAACGDDPAGPVDPTPTPTPITETFTGTLTVNGAITFPVFVNQAGSANATMKALTPIRIIRMAAGGTGDYIVGETVYQGASLADATVTGVVHGWNPATATLTLATVSATGGFGVDIPVVGATTGVTRTTAQVNATVVGMALGTWSGTTCSVVLANDITSVGSTVAGAVQGSGALCARVYDVGQIVTPTTFTIDVSHF